MSISIRSLFFVISLSCLLPLLNGCASIARGVTEGIMAGRQQQGGPDPGICNIRGPAFSGLGAMLERQTELGGTHSTKVMMVHGIGKHLPGYSVRLQDKLTTALGLNVVEDKFKEFTILPPSVGLLDLGDEALGNLRIHRYLNEDESRELLFYELAWSQITEEQKEVLAYDDSEEYAYRRATVNRLAKSFFNNAIPDPIIYAGDTQLRIMSAVTQSFCWVHSGDWDDLPDSGAHACPVRSAALPRNVREDHLSIVTHSLGSRITMDALQAMAQLGRQLRTRVPELGQALQNEEVPIYMLANQLPLLQLGFTDPEVVDAIADYCRPDGAHYAERMFKRVRVIAFSDPNDILSYAIPPQFAERYISSQLCPEIINVTLNVTPVQSLPVLGDFANPLAAHSDYEIDPRVIGLMVDGISKSHRAGIVQESCSWTETR